MCVSVLFVLLMFSVSVQCLECLDSVQCLECLDSVQCLECLDAVKSLEYFGRIQTLGAPKIPQMKAAKYIFIFNRLTVALSLEKMAYPENSHIFHTVILN